MCRICNLDKISKQYRWPASVVPLTLALQARIPAAHEAFHFYARPTPRGQESINYTKSSLMQHVNSLYSDIKQINTARESWWQGKKELRERLQSDIEKERETQNFQATTHSEKAKQEQKGAQETYNELQAINTRAINMIADMRNSLNGLCRHVLDILPEELNNFQVELDE